MKTVLHTLAALLIVGLSVFCFGLLMRAADRSLEAEYKSLAHYHSGPGGSYTSPCFIRHTSGRSAR